MVDKGVDRMKIRMDKYKPIGNFVFACRRASKNLAELHACCLGRAAALLEARTKPFGLHVRGPFVAPTSRRVGAARASRTPVRALAQSVAIFGPTKPEC